MRVCALRQNDWRSFGYCPLFDEVGLARSVLFDEVKIPRVQLGALRAYFSGLADFSGRA